MAELTLDHEEVVEILARSQGLDPSQIQGFVRCNHKTNPHTMRVVLKYNAIGGNRDEGRASTGRGEAADQRG
jgi:hypothetical protein